MADLSKSGTESLGTRLQTPGATSLLPQTTPRGPDARSASGMASRLAAILSPTSAARR